jgi:hypothetical protein
MDTTWHIALIATLSCFDQCELLYTCNKFVYYSSSGQVSVLTALVDRRAFGMYFFCVLYLSFCIATCSGLLLDRANQRFWAGCGLSVPCGFRTALSDSLFDQVDLHSGTYMLLTDTRYQGGTAICHQTHCSVSATFEIQNCMLDSD